MNIKIDSLSPKGISVNIDSDSQLNFTEVVETKTTSFVNGVKNYIRTLFLSDIIISQIQIDSNQEADYSIEINEPVIKMVFLISTCSSFQLKKDKTIHIKNNQHNIFYYSQNSYLNSWACGQNQKAIIITIYPEKILRFLPKEKFSVFLQNIEKQRNAILFEENLNITPRMHILLNEIIADKFPEGMRRLHIESGIFELFFLQIEQYTYLKGKHNKINYSSLENKIVEAKNYIEDNLAHSYSIADLAGILNINEYHLKKGFKILYNTTVYSYIIKRRMEKAKDLLLNDDFNVNEVASLMGYNDATNFTAAFKKHFGFTPGKIT